MRAREFKFAGRFEIVNLRTGKKVSAEGVFTRNLPRILNALWRCLSDVASGQEETVAVKDVNGNDVVIVVVGNKQASGSTTSYGALEAIMATSAITIVVGAYFKLGSGSTTPTPDDFNLEVEEVSGIALTNAVKEQTSSTTIELTASLVSPKAFTCNEVGLFMRILKGGENNTETVDIMIDRAVISSVEFAENDPIAIRYALTFT
ncbi:hypothetical protein J7L13_01830 [bacterium]|nr:hypothetical protein [bacterium]